MKKFLKIIFIITVVSAVLGGIIATNRQEYLDKGGNILNRIELSGLEELNDWDLTDAERGVGITFTNISEYTAHTDEFYTYITDSTGYKGTCTLRDVAGNGYEIGPGETAYFAYDCFMMDDERVVSYGMKPRD